MNGQPFENPNLQQRLAQAIADLEDLQCNLTARQSEAAQARNRETDALNAVNCAQKHFDALVAEMKKSAPQSTDWKRQPRQEHPA
jgi:hypothetical protein